MLRAALSVDLDNYWTYLRSAGSSDWRRYPTWLDRLVPEFLELFDHQGLRGTFFMIGRDALQAAHREAFSAVTAAGHEAGNHSFDHDPALLASGQAAVESQIAQAEESIAAVTGQRPTGYRGPEFHLNGEVLDCLERRGYHYDASSLPTLLTPVIRRFRRRISSSEGDEAPAAHRDVGIADGYASLRAYRWRRSDGLIELPVTTMPLLRLPLHMTYINALCDVSHRLGEIYFRAGIRLCQVLRIEPVLLLHPTDLVGCDSPWRLPGFPGMAAAGSVKRRRLERMLEWMRGRFRIVTLGELAGDSGSQRALSVRSLPRALACRT